MHVNEKTRACRCWYELPERGGRVRQRTPRRDCVSAPKSVHCRGGAVAAAREPVLLAGGVSQLGSVHGLQALLALVAQDRQDGAEVGCSAAWHAGRR